MDNFETNSKWKGELEVIFLEIYKKLYITILLFLNLFLFGIFIQSFYSNFFQIFHLTYFLPLAIFLDSILIYAILRLKTKKFENFFYLLIILFYDGLVLYALISAYLHKDNELYSRSLYYELCFSLMYINIKFDHSRGNLVFLGIYKAVLLFIFLFFYDYKSLKESMLIIDVFMISMCIGMIIANLFTNKKLFNNLELLDQKNNSLNNKFKNIFNAIKSPLISINIKKQEIHFNLAFKKFIKENSNLDNEIEEYLFENVSENIEINNEYINSLKEKVSDEELCFLEKIGKDKAITSFKNRLLILNRIFCDYVLENDLKQESKENLNIFNLMRYGRKFKDEEYFEYLGEYKIISPHEKFFEVSWRKTIYSQNEEVIDIMLNEITLVKEIQFTKADTIYKKIYLAKIAHEFKTPISSLIYSVKDLVNGLPKNINCHGQDISHKINFIEGQANFLSILIHDINDYCKDIKDFDINIESVKIRDSVNFCFEILNSLVKKDTYKKNNVMTYLNISKNVPIFINTDERRLKQLLVNMLSNSVKFTNFGHICLNVEYIPKIIENEYSELKFTIEDTGIGINKEDQMLLFQDYSNLNKEYFKMNKDGTGLGLSICKKIIQKLGNNINCLCENSLTQFSFNLFDFISNKQNNVVLSQNISLKSEIDEDTIILYKPQVENKEIKINISKDNNKQEELMKKLSSKISSININIEDSTSGVQRVDLWKSKTNQVIPLKNNEDAYHGLYLMNDLNESEINFIKSKTNRVKMNVDLISFKNNKEDHVNNSYIEKELINSIQKTNNIIKKNFLIFCKPLIDYSNYMANNIKDLELILIVDDESINSKSLSNLITKYHVEKGISNRKIIILNDGIEALNLIYFDTIFNMKIKTIICDLNMNFMNGDNLFKNLNQINKNAFKRIKFIMYTNTDLSYVNQIVCGLKYYLRKPCTNIDIEKLFSNLNDLN